MTRPEVGDSRKWKSAVDMAMGGGGHNLLPFEWLAYAFYMALGTIGSAVGRGARIRFKAKRARGRADAD